MHRIPAVETTSAVSVGELARSDRRVQPPQVAQKLLEMAWGSEFVFILNSHKTSKAASTCPVNPPEKGNKKQHSSAKNEALFTLK